MQLYHMGGPWIGQTFYVAAELGLADYLGSDPVSVAELATRTEANEEALYRFCRVLAALGVLEAHPDRHFSLTEAGYALRSDAPGGFRYGVMLQSGACFRAWTEVMHTVRTGKPAFDKVHGAAYYDYLDANPAENELFNRAMGVTSLAPAIAALERYDFTGIKRVVDVGGGVGTLLAAVLRMNPGMSGVVQDLATVAAEAPAHLAEQGVQDRVDVVTGSFFDSVVPGADAYVLSRVLHNWNDDDCLKILRRVHQAMPPHGKLIVIDSVVPESGGLHPSMLADLFMMVILGGKERTEADWQRLLFEAGFRMTRAVQADNVGDTLVHALVEAVPR
ncbi:methyltransferase [Solwaraspora sp. WMMD406]|uniref:methyltransferase n=1 Tax=Solwaraspora sp. WMMD406 TaxID=3016095 RepID=UPI002416A69E|nr:methyltransferase [Solwaraspora sp. WMMD406]MDG4763509.1 methyltransferase [Solwaraspora sp. WMMD406]